VRLHHAKRRDGAAALRLVILLSAAASVVGCSLLDGWGGLEGGGNAGNAGHDAAGASDGGTGARDADSAGDGDSDAATMAVVGVACGSAHCAPGEGCCLSPGIGGGTCMQPTACGGAGNYFFLCDDSSECTALGAQAKCCLNIGGTGTLSASCAPETATCQSTLCSDPGSACPTGGHCVQSTTGAFPLPNGYYVCQ
jgi:hypothetical protein